MPWASLRTDVELADQVGTFSPMPSNNLVWLIVGVLAIIALLIWIIPQLG